MSIQEPDSLQLSPDSQNSGSCRKHTCPSGEMHESGGPHSCGGHICRFASQMMAQQEASYEPYRISRQYQGLQKPFVCMHTSEITVAEDNLVCQRKTHFNSAQRIGVAIQYAGQMADRSGEPTGLLTFLFIAGCGAILASMQTVSQFLSSYVGLNHQYFSV